jgi:hypothetical protein
VIHALCSRRKAKKYPTASYGATNQRARTKRGPSGICGRPPCKSRAARHASSAGRSRGPSSSIEPTSSASSVDMVCSSCSSALPAWAGVHLTHMASGAVPPPSSRRRYPTTVRSLQPTAAAVPVRGLGLALALQATHRCSQSASSAIRRINTRQRRSASSVNRGSPLVARFQPIVRASSESVALLRRLEIPESRLGNDDTAQTLGRTGVSPPRASWKSSPMVSRPERRINIQEAKTMAREGCRTRIP